MLYSNLFAAPFRIAFPSLKIFRCRVPLLPNNMIQVLIMIPFLAPVGPVIPQPGAHGSSVASSHHPAMRSTQGHVGPQGVTEEGAPYQMPVAHSAVYHAQQQPGAMPGYETFSQGFRSDPASGQRYFHNMHDGNAMATSGTGRSWQANMGHEHNWMM